MQAIVPAAGEGTRMGSLTDDRPKGVLDINGRPLLAYVFDRLEGLGIERVVVVIGYKGKQIVDRFGNQYDGMALKYARQPEPLGLADAVWQAHDRIDDRFVVLNGDNVFLDPLDGITTALDKADGALLVETADPEAVARGGEVRTEGDRVTRVIEKPDAPTSNLTTTGCYLLPEAALEVCGTVSPSARGERELADAINELIDRGHRFEAVRFEGWRRNVNTAEDIEIVEARL